MIIFGSVRFLPLKNNQTGKKNKPNRNRLKPTGFGSVLGRFLMPKTKKTYMQIFYAQFSYHLLASRLLVHFLLTQLQCGPWII